MNSEAKLAIERALALAEEQLDAADVLAQRPHRAEALRVQARALASLELAAEQLGVLLSTDQSAAILALRTQRERIAQAPASDAELSRADLRALASGQKLMRRTLRALRRSLLSRRELLARRVPLALSLAIAVGATGVLLVQLRDRYQVSASASYVRQLGPELATDGNPDTEWLAPDHRQAWVELAFVQPIEVTAVRVINAHNPPHEDRGTRALEVELYAGDQRVAVGSFEFPMLEPVRRSRELPISGTGITRVRFLARSYFGKGVGLAEVEVIEAR